MLYRFELTEVYSKQITIESDSRAEAETKLIDNYDIGAIELTEEDFQGARIEPKLEWPKVSTTQDETAAKLYEKYASAKN